MKISYIITLLGLVIGLNIEAQTTRLASSLCDGNLSTMGSNITCNVNLGTGHRFEVSRLDGSVIGVYDAIAASSQFPSRSRYIMRFTWMSNCAISYNSTYRIRVSWFNGSNWSEYGQYCNVSTPIAGLHLSSTFCNGSVTNLGQNVTTNLNHECGHRFEVRSQSNDLLSIYDAYNANQLNPAVSPYNFRFSFVEPGIIQEGGTYRIRVASYNNELDTWSDYGASCELSTPGQTVSIRSSFCGTTIPSLGSNITASSSNGTNIGSGYRFEVRLANEEFVGVYDGIAALSTSPNRSPYIFRFSWMPSGTIFLNTVYRIRVAWFNTVSNTWSAYGPACNIQTPGQPLTQLSNQWCDNDNISDENVNISANIVSGVSEYHFNISSSEYGHITTLVKSTNNFQLSELPSPHPIFNEQYDVTVQTRTHPTSQLSNAGNSCFVMLAVPTTVISNANCGRSYNYLIQDSIFAVPATGAQMYRYRLIDQTSNAVLLDTVANRSTYNGVSLSKFPGIQYGRTYRISVAIRVNGVWGNYGNECIITTVAVPQTELRPDYCNSTVASCGTNIYLRAILYSTAHQFQIIGGNVNEIYQNPNGNLVFRFSWLEQFPNVQFGETYSVRCRVFVNGDWTPWGNVCNVTLAQPNSRLTAYCNGTVPSWSTSVLTSLVGCATDYRFLFNGPGMNNVIFNPSNFTNQFRPSQLTSLGMIGNTTYSVRVSAFAGGEWSPWGDVCNMTSPPPTTIMPDIDITEMEESYELETAEVLTVNTNSINSPKYSVFPNPFNTNINILGVGLKNETQNIFIYDNLGRLIFSKVYTKEELIEGIVIGQALPNGIYTILISSDNIQQSFRVVKPF